MSVITKNNYEAFLLDYFEENISAEMAAELMLFLEQNPDLNVNLNNFEIIPLQAKNKLFTNKKSLKKDEYAINLANYETFFIAEIEGINTIEDSAELQVFLKNNPKTRQIFDTYKNTKLTSSRLVFKDKKSLYRKEKKVIPLYWWYSSVAAVLIVVLFLKITHQQNKKANSFVATPSKEILKTNQVQDQLKQNTQKAIKPKINKLKVAKSTKKIASITKNKKRIIKPITNNLLTKIEAKDTTKIILTEPKKEKNLYANNVKITFDDEPKSVQTIFAKPKLTKFAIITKLLKKPFIKIFHQQRNKDGNVVAYAFNMGKIGFYRNRHSER